MKVDESLRSDSSWPEVDGWAHILKKVCPKQRLQAWIIQKYFPFFAADVIVIQILL